MGKMTGENAFHEDVTTMHLFFAFFCHMITFEYDNMKEDENGNAENH